MASRPVVWLVAAWGISAGVFVPTCHAVDPVPLVTYDQVRPVFRKHCVTCHNSDRPRGDLDLSNLEAIKAGSGSGAAAVAGKPDESLLYTMPAHLEEPHMPPNSPKIPQRELDLIRRWIEGGLLDRDGSEASKAAPTLGRPNTSLAQGAPVAAASTVVAVASLPRPTPITALAVSPTAPIVAVSGSRQAVLFSLSDQKPARAFEFPGEVFCLRFSRDGTVLVIAGGAGGLSGHVVGVEVASGKQLFDVGDEADAVLAVDLSPDKSLVALGGPGRTVKMLRTVDGQPTATLRKHTDWILSLAFSPDGLLLASGDRFGGLQVWEAESGHELHTLRGHVGAVHALAWADDSERLLSAGHDGELRLWDMHRGALIHQWDGGAGAVLAVDRAASGRMVCGGRDRKVVVWDGPEQRVHQIPFGDEVNKLGLTADGAHAIIGDARGEISVIALSDGTVARRFTLPIDSTLVRRSASPAVPRALPTATVPATDRLGLGVAEAESRRAASDLAEAQRAASLAEAAVKSAEQALSRSKETAAELKAIVTRREAAARQAAARAAELRAKGSAR